MNINKALIALIFMLASALSQAAEQPSIKAFVPGSYQQILTENTGKGFMLVLWSLDCTTCIKDMELLSIIRKKQPALKIILISTDEFSAAAEVKTLLDKYQLGDAENWLFADDNSQKLRYEIDPSWYSELPRTYFYSADHRREGVSGSLTAEEYTERFKKMKIP